jgi:hypothetical protein
MKSHRLAFENRWTGGEHAWQWYCELERMGVANVRAMFVDHEMHHADDNSVVFDVPAGFVRDWLSFHDRHDARRQTLWLARPPCWRLSPLSLPSSLCCGRSRALLAAIGPWPIIAAPRRSFRRRAGI